jgi:predicted nucleotidyltransferase
MTNEGRINMDESLLQQITETLDHLFPDIQAIYLFGSMVEGIKHPGSDVDVAVLARGLITPEICWELAQKLALVLKSDVDLIDLRQATTVMQKEVVTKGKRILCRDLIAVELFEAFVFSSYARLNEERGEILASVLENGSVYGS